MSRQSKAKRDARRRKEPKRPIRRLGAPLQPHAQLLDADGHAVGGAGWRDGQWLTLLGGQVVARTDSAAMTLAMLRHLAALQERAGHAVRLAWSPTLEQAATGEAAAAGQTLEAHLQWLEEERAARAAEGESAPDDDATPDGDGAASERADTTPPDA